jgi:hypothetical protein
MLPGGPTRSIRMPMTLKIVAKRSLAIKDRLPLNEALLLLRDLICADRRDNRYRIRAIVAWAKNLRHRIIL